MASPSFGPCVFAFGVELEMQLKPRNTSMVRNCRSELEWEKPSPNRADNKQKLRLLVEECLALNGVSTTMDTGRAMWTVTDVPSITAEFDGFWDVKLVSAVLWTDWDWTPDLKLLYFSLNDFFEIAINHQCATHVLVFPSANCGLDWPLADLKSILKAAACFKESITTVVSRECKVTPQALSNFGSPYSPGLFRGIYDEAARGISGLHPLFSKIDQIESPAHIEKIFQRERTWTWDFSRLWGPEDGRARLCGAVEFRRPPGSKIPKEALHWISFTLSFIAMAVRTDFNQPDFEVPADVDQLYEFLLAGDSLLPPTSQGRIEPTLLVKREDESILVTEEDDQRITQERVDWVFAPKL